jgi:preprotein translocase subunit SecF
MNEEFEVHGQHDHAVEHAAHTDSLGRWVAMFTAILATMGALISYQNGNAESRGLELKNEAILKKSAASDQWAYYQAKGIKQVIVERATATTADERTAQAAEAARYAKEKEAIQVEAKKLDAESAASDAESMKAVAPHHQLARALALVQVAIAMAALTVLTRQRWMLGFSGLCAAGGIVFWITAWL